MTIEAIGFDLASDSEFYVIFVDNQGVLRAFAVGLVQSQLDRVCKKLLKNFGSDHIHLCRVQGHSEILGNETEDAPALDPKICLCGLINGRVKGEEQRPLGKASGCYVSRCLCPPIGCVRRG